MNKKIEKERNRERDDSMRSSSHNSFRFHNFAKIPDIPKDTKSTDELQKALEESKSTLFISK